MRAVDEVATAHASTSTHSEVMANPCNPSAVRVILCQVLTVAALAPHDAFKLHDTSLEVLDYVLLFLICQAD